MLGNRCYSWPVSFCRGVGLRSHVLVAFVRILRPSSYIYCIFLLLSNLAHSFSCRPEYSDYAHCSLSRRLSRQCLSFSCWRDCRRPLQSRTSAGSNDDFHGGAVHRALSRPSDWWFYQSIHFVEVDILCPDYLERGNAGLHNNLCARNISPCAPKKQGQEIEKRDRRREMESATGEGE